MEEQPPVQPVVQPPLHLELFALHARFGPLAGFDGDVRTYTVYLGEPQVLYALAPGLEKVRVPFTRW